MWVNVRMDFSAFSNARHCCLRPSRALLFLTTCSFHSSLYLPQAKVYDKCAGLGPCLFVPEKPIDPDTKIRLEILREGNVVFEGETHISQMKRSHHDLVEYLTRECSFPQGVYLMTGTCIVPDYPFTLQAGDEILIEIDHIGILKNIVSE